MSKNLSELLADARGAAIRYGDVDVTAIYELPLTTSSVLRVTFSEFSRQVPQGLRFRAEGATIGTNGLTLTDAVFWTDTAPPQFDVTVTPSRKRVVLKIWNEWRDEHGLEHAWIGNAGMVVERDGDRMLIRCSDGVGAVSFTDMVVRLSITSNVLQIARRPR